MADIVGFLKHTLPSMAAAVASGIPGPIGAVAQLVSAAVGKDISPEAKSIAQAVANATPDQIIKLKEDDQTFQETMRKMGFDHDEKLEELAVSDRSSARDREKTVRDRTPQNGFYILSVGFFGLILALIIFKPPIENQRLIDVMLGTLGTAWLTSVAYFYGSSASHARTTELLAQSTPAAN